MQTPNFAANGTITPSTFVTIDTGTANSVTQTAVTTLLPIGVSQEWSKYAPIPSASSVAAEVGDPIKVYGEGEFALLMATSAGWTAGDRLTATTNGYGITASTTNYYGAVALTTLTGAGLGRVQVIIGKNP